MVLYFSVSKFQGGDMRFVKKIAIALILSFVGANGDGLVPTSGFFNQQKVNNSQISGCKPKLFDLNPKNDINTSKCQTTQLKSPFFGQIKKGLDEGSVDLEWFLKNYQNLPKDIAIVDVRDSDERESGFVPDSIHISLYETNTKDFIQKMPKNYVIFCCSSGSRAMEAWQKSRKLGFEKTLYLDAVIECKADKCEFIPNDPLDPTDW